MGEGNRPGIGSSSSREERTANQKGPKVLMAPVRREGGRKRTIDDSGGRVKAQGQHRVNRNVLF